jgi:hypothetical protein
VALVYCAWAATGTDATVAAGAAITKRKKSGAPRLRYEIRMQPEHFAQREVPHLASLRYNSAFFESTLEERPDHDG